MHSHDFQFKTVTFQKSFKKLTLLVVLLCVGFQLSCSKQEDRSLPFIKSLPEFALTDQNSQKIPLSQLKGKVWVANFIFTSCAGTCPMLTQKMTRVQGAIQKFQKQNGSAAAECKIVSFSVDPERDTPAKLLEYSKKYRVDGSIWYFLTGSLDEVKSTVVDGFKMSMQKNELNPGAEDITEFDVVHGEKFILVDRKGWIRGYYDANADGIDQLISDMQFLSTQKEG